MTTHSFYPGPLEKQVKLLGVDLNKTTSLEKLHVFYKTIQSIYTGLVQQEVDSLPYTYVKILEKDIRRIIRDVREASTNLRSKRSELRDISKYLRKAHVKTGLVLKLFEELGNEDQMRQRADGIEKQIDAMVELQESLFHALQSWPKDLQ